MRNRRLVTSRDLILSRTTTSYSPETVSHHFYPLKDQSSPTLHYTPTVITTPVVQTPVERHTIYSQSRLYHSTSSVFPTVDFSY